MVPIPRRTDVAVAVVADTMAVAGIAGATPASVVDTQGTAVVTAAVETADGSVVSAADDLCVSLTSISMSPTATAFTVINSRGTVLVTL